MLKIGDKVKVVGHSINGIDCPFFIGIIVGVSSPYYLIKKPSTVRIRVHKKYIKSYSCFKNKLK